MPENNKVCFLTGNIRLTSGDYIKIAGTAAIGTLVGSLLGRIIWSKITKNKNKDIRKIVEEVLRNTTTE
jgi:hypothetical protein